MNCEDAKELLRRGYRGRVHEHLTSCPDCLAFAEDFTDVAEYLNRLPEVQSSPDELLSNTFASARAELDALGTHKARSARFRTAMAAVFALMAAPPLIVLNYVMAAGGQVLLSRWLPPAFGLAFFVVQATGAIVALSLAYGSLPLLIGAARNILCTRTDQGGLIA